MTSDQHPQEQQETRRSASAALLAAASGDSEEMSVGELLEALEDRAFGMAMLLFALPCCLPFVYGIPQVLSVPMLLIALQIVSGRHRLWLPESLKRRTFSRAGFAEVAERSQKYLKWFEALSRPRLSYLTRGAAERVFGLFMAIFCVSIALPLPLTNSMPALAVAIMSIGFIERDGLLVIAGTLLGTFWVLMLAFFAAAFFAFLAWIGAELITLWTWLLGLLS